MARIYIAMPIYKEMHPATREALNNFTQCTEHTVMVRAVRNEPIIDHARQALLGSYLYHWHRFRFTHYLQLDSDIWFESGAIDRLLRHDKPVTCGVYTFKLESRQPIINADPGEVVDPLTSLIKCNRMPGGFLLLKNSVLVRMRLLHPELRYLIPKGLYGYEENAHTYALWSGLIRPWPHFGPNEHIYFGEDYAFTTRLNEAGYPVWADLSIHLRHCAGQEFYEPEFKEEEGDRK